MRKSDALKALSKSQAEIQLWKSRFETEGMGRIEELEGARNKLQSKIVENEELVDVLSTKVANAEKSKAADLQAEINASQDEGRNYSSELFRLKAAQQESVEQLDVVKRENKNLADEIKDLLDQLGEGGRSIHALDKQRRMLEMEENRVLRSQLELANVRQEIDRRVAEKEDEFNNTRKNHARAMDSLGASIETEQRAKGEALRVKKQLEGEINELEIGLDHANKANAEGLRASSAIKPSFVRPSSSLRMKLVQKHKLLSKLASLSARQLLSLEKLRKAKPFWMDLAVLSVSCRQTSLMLVVLLTTCRLSTDAI